MRASAASWRRSGSPQCSRSWIGIRRAGLSLMPGRVPAVRCCPGLHREERGRVPRTTTQAELSNNRLTDHRAQSKFSVARDTLPSQLTAKLRLAITRGDLRPGTRLTEVSLALQAGVSRSTVREALRTLAKDGLVTLVPMAGARVTTLTLKDVREIGESRIALETYAARLAAASPQSNPREAVENLSRLAGAVKELRWANIVDADVGFHRTFIAATGNSRLLQFWQSLEGQIRLYLSYHAREAYDLKTLVNAHRKLLRSVEARNPDRAAEAFRSHIVERTQWRERVWSQLTGAEKNDLPSPRGAAHDTLSRSVAMHAARSSTGSVARKP